MIQLALKQQMVQHLKKHRISTIQDELVMDIVMTSITTWVAAMMVETVVDVMLKHPTVQYVDALIQMEAGMAQHAHKQQQVLQIQRQALQIQQQSLQIQQQ